MLIGLSLLFYCLVAIIESIWMLQSLGVSTRFTSCLSKFIFYVVSLFYWSVKLSNSYFMIPFRLSLDFIQVQRFSNFEVITTGHEKINFRFVYWTEVTMYYWFVWFICIHLACFACLDFSLWFGLFVRIFVISNTRRVISVYIIQMKSLWICVDFSIETPLDSAREMKLTNKMTNLTKWMEKCHLR